jgi:ferrous iron transport protein A
MNLPLNASLINQAIAASVNASVNAPASASASLRLDQCAKGTQLRVVNLLKQPLFGAQDERVTLRLKELGFLPGALLKVIGFGLLGSDPLAVQVNGTKFALRRAEAAKIGVELVGKH